MGRAHGLDHAPHLGLQATFRLAGRLGWKPNRTRANAPLRAAPSSSSSSWLPSAPDTFATRRKLGGRTRMSASRRTQGPTPLCCAFGARPRCAGLWRSNAVRGEDARFILTHELCSSTRFALADRPSREVHKAFDTANFKARKKVQTKMINNYMKRWLFDTKATVVRRDINDALKYVTRSELKAFVKALGWEFEEKNGQFVIYKKMLAA